MPGDLQPLALNFKIVDDNGFPTPYFIKWAQQRQIDITAGITAAQAQQLINDWAAGRQIIAGAGLTGGGTLAADRTIDVNPGTGIMVAGDAVGLTNTAVTPGTYGDATHVGQFTVDQQGRITAAANVAITGGGGGGGTPWYYAPPTAASLTLKSGNASQAVLTDVANAGLRMDYGTLVSGNVQHLALKTITTPSADWTFTAHVAITTTKTNYSNAGICCIIDSSGKGIASQFTNTQSWNASRHANLTTYTSETVMKASAYQIAPTAWVRIKYVASSSTIFFYTSGDGLHWTAWYSETIASFLGATPDRVGLFLNSNSAPTNEDLGLLCDYFVLTP